MCMRVLLGVLLVWLVTSQLLALDSGTQTTPGTGQPAETTLWTPQEWARARRCSPLPAPPPDPTNALSDNLAAARLGHRLFFETRLSPKGIACATCHQPHLGFTDGLTVANTLAPLRRNTMTILNVGYYRWLTWDGSRDSLWHQAVGPIESAQEMGSSRLYVVRAVMQHYGRELTQLVALPSGWQEVWPVLPASGAPGEPAYDTLPPARQEAVNRVFSTILKVMASYERHVVSAPTPFDRYVAGERTALSLSAQRGFQHFLRLQCDTCHSTPLFSDDEFHNLGLSSAQAPDHGRAAGLPLLQHSPWRGTGPYADGPPSVRAEDYQPGQALVGSFRTPSLRELASTAPYGHNGTIATLEAWIEHYVRITSLPITDVLGRLDPALGALEITPQEKQGLVDFLRSLSSTYTSEWTQTPEDSTALHE